MDSGYCFKKEGKLTLVINKQFILKMINMKHLSIPAIFFTLVILIAVSCKKTITYPPGSHGVSRTIQFSLYTDKDFSGDNNTIAFKLFIQNSKNKILWDSALAPMRIKDIPDVAHKLVVEKIVPSNDTSLLGVGFRYSIEGVGNSWFLDTCTSGETFKRVEFNFQ